MKTLLIGMLSFYLISVSKCGAQQEDKAPCFTDRSVVKILEEVELRCQSVSSELVLLLNVETNERYSVCNYSDFEIKADTNYKVTGKSYEIKPNERWPGTPFEITSLKK